jgi:hypothetical protein
MSERALDAVEKVAEGVDKLLEPVIGMGPA